MSSHAHVLHLNKGLGSIDRAVQRDEVVAPRWNLLREDLSLPSAVLYQNKLRHNLEWMQRFIAAYGVKFAPHGKTTMAPRLFEMQIAAGAWGITLATAHQTLVAYTHGVRRILMANQLVGKENMAIVGRLLCDPKFEYYCLVDSSEQVQQLGAFYSRSPCSQQAQPLRVLIELGVTGGRTGIRTEEQLRSVLSALSLWSSAIVLCGIELYEGVLDSEVSVRSLLQHAVAVTRRLAAEGRFQRHPILLSGAGSAWYDVVADVFAAANFGAEVDIVLRPGCYLVHDVGVYHQSQTSILARNPVAGRMNSSLLPALQVWAYVQSIPEPEMAIVAMGKRDASFDAGLPVAALRYRPGQLAPCAAPKHWSLTKMMDQHSYLQVSADDDLRVGDMIGFDISHPCLTFDKWRTLPVLNAGYDVIDIVDTFF